MRCEVNAVSHAVSLYEYWCEAFAPTMILRHQLFANQLGASQPLLLFYPICPTSIVCTIVAPLASVCFVGLSVYLQSIWIFALRLVVTCHV